MLLGANIKRASTRSERWLPVFRLLTVSFLFLAGCGGVDVVRDGYIIFIGDSLTASSSEVDQEDTYPSILGERWGRKTINISRAGMTSGEAVSWAGGRAGDAIREMGDPAAFFIAVGANDQLRGIDPSHAGEALTELVGLAKETGAKVFLVRCIVPLRNRGYDSVYKNTARGAEAELSADIIQEYFQEAGGRGVDGIHPSIKGHVAIAEGLDRDFKHFFRR